MDSFKSVPINPYVSRLEFVDDGEKYEKCPRHPHMPIMDGAPECREGYLYSSEYADPPEWGNFGFETPEPAAPEYECSHEAAADGELRCMGSNATWRVAEHPRGEES